MYAFSRMGNPQPGETLLIGDSRLSDIRGAVDYGIDSSWYNPKGLARPASPAIKHEIRALSELPAPLDRCG